MRTRALVLVCGAVGLGPVHGCSSTGAPVARFELGTGSAPAFLDVPFPTDAYLDATGHITDPIPGFDAIVTQNGELIERELAELDGFSRITHALFRVDDTSQPVDQNGNLQSASIDQTSLPYDETACMADGSSVFLLDLDAQQRVLCRAYFHDDRDIGSLSPPVIAVGPARGIVLDEHHHYAAVLTNRVRDTHGRALQPSVSFATLAMQTGPVATLYQAALTQAHALLSTALADGASIVSIAPFTTHTRARELFQARATLDAIPIPHLSFAAQDLAPMGAARFSKLVGGAVPSGFTASLDAWLGVVDPKNVLSDGEDDWDNRLPVRPHNKIAAWGTGVFSAASFLQSLPGGFDNPQQLHFARDASGNIVQDGSYKIWVSIAVPDAPMPPGGYPTVIIQHGLGSSREYVVETANLFCARGWIAVGIDSITFGARALEPQYQVDTTTDYVSAPGATYNGPDGIADNTAQGRAPPTDLFGNFSNFGAFRDQMREAALDTAQLERVLANDPDLSPLATDRGTPHIDPSHIAYVGESLGSLEGEIAAAIVPQIEPWVFSVGGGGFIFEAAVHGPSIGALLGAAGGLYFHFLHERLTEFHPLVNLFQTAMETADPLLYGRNLVREPVKGPPHSVMLLECLYDELVANEAGEAWAREAGLLLATPNVGVNSSVTDLKNPSNGRWHVPLPVTAPDSSGTIHDVPQNGLTDVVVQLDPCSHGSDWVSSVGTRHFAIPYVSYTSPVLYTRLMSSFDITEDYRAAGTQIAQFIGDSFSGMVPHVVVRTNPIRDFDGDTYTDDIDKDPSNPLVH